MEQPLEQLIDKAVGKAVDSLGWMEPTVLRKVTVATVLRKVAVATVLRKVTVATLLHKVAVAVATDCSWEEPVHSFGLHLVGLDIIQVAEEPIDIIGWDLSSFLFLINNYN